MQTDIGLHTCIHSSSSSSSNSSKLAKRAKTSRLQARLWLQAASNCHEANERRLKSRAESGLWGSWTTYCGNMTSHQFFKMAAAAAQYYFRFCVYWFHCIQKVKVYQQTKFVDISHNYFRFWKKQTSAILEFYFRFRSRYFAVICTAPGYRISSKSNHPLRKYFRNMKPEIFFDVTSIFQDGGRGSSILLPVSYLLKPLGRSKSISKPNFVDISQFVADI